MKYNKKVLNIMLAAAIAVPMGMTSVFADMGYAKFEKQDQDGKPLAGATFDVYRVGAAADPDKKLITFTTNDKGKADSLTKVDHAKGVNENDMSDAINDSELHFEEGAYYLREVTAPKGYMVNVKQENFTITKTSDDAQVTVKNQKFAEGTGQLILTSVDAKEKSPVPNATIEIHNSKNELVGTFNSNDDGYVMNIAADEAKGVSTYNNTIVLPAGAYTIKETNVGGNYATITKEGKVEIPDQGTYKFELAHEVKPEPTPDPNTTPGTDSTTEKTTGVKIRVLNKKDDSPLSGQVIAVYSKGLTEKKVFEGKTGSDGYLNATGATMGSDLIKDGVLVLPEGDYYYKLAKYSSSMNHDFKVEKGEVGDQTLKLTTSSSSGSSSTSSKDDDKKKKKKKSTRSSSSSSSDDKKLARTGFENATRYTVGGLGLVAVGGILLRKKK